MSKVQEYAIKWLLAGVDDEVSVLTNKVSILVVDDDPDILGILESCLLPQGHQVFTASGVDEAMGLLGEHEMDLLISDVQMPDKGGLQLLEEVRKRQLGLPVIFLTGFGSIPEAVHAIKAGAVDYLTKPFSTEDLLNMVEKVLDSVRVPVMEEAFSSLSERFYGGNSPAIRKLYDLIERVSSSDVNVLILGESGVGKEVVARLIHERGVRAEKPLVVVDCGSIPRELMESELFGHLKGSFTHAVSNKCGLIEAAEGGTLLLDEIGNISPEMQVRLLRFLEQRNIRKVGDVREIPVDCRVISATNTDLPREVEEGRFREDLYYRLRVVMLKIPPLRERREDIPLIAGRFVRDICKERGVPEIELHPAVVEWLCCYSWPGNVRELKNALSGAIALCDHRLLLPEHLHLTGLSDAKLPDSVAENCLHLEESERNLIIRALKETGGVQKDAAPLLGISPRSLNYKIKKLGIKLM
ncbi:MAG: sigma-54-dependent Fis family transcriptional regulator [Deltaproteobacteria bacterium]|nr:sigma-54-dependent Fis family transcriptional regulator [Deltaproteobacteria bacterium]